MAYIILLSNGTQLTTVQDGTLNTTNAGLSLIGKGYSGFGTAHNDNSVHLAENFANSLPPANPLTGQLWYDTANKAIKIYNGSVFKNISVSTASATAPSNAILGDEWFDTINQQLRVYNGSIWVLIGPTSLASSGLNGVITNTVIQNSSTYYTADLYANNRLVGKISSDNLINPSVAGFGNIRPGVNFVTSPSSAIVQGGLYNVQEITLGTADQFVLNVDVNTNNPIISSTVSGTKILVQVNNSNVVSFNQNVVLPEIADRIDLGNVNNKFGNIYAGNIYGTVINSASAQLNANIANLTARVGTLETQEISLASNVTTLNTAITTINGQFVNVTSNLTAQQSAINSLTALENQLNSNLSNAVTRIGSVENSVVDINNQITSVNNQITVINANVSSNSNRISVLESPSTVQNTNGRSFNTQYQNTSTTRTLFITVTAQVAGNSGTTMTVYTGQNAGSLNVVAVQSVIAAGSGNASGTVNLMVPSGFFYQVNCSSPSLQYWTEVLF